MSSFTLLDPIEFETEFTPSIRDAEQAAKGFNSLVIKLDATSDSSLEWQQACQTARKRIDEGYFIFWEIDLGLFDRLRMPLSDPTQFLALQLALKHFREKIWTEFSSHTLGASVYRGDLDFSRSKVWEHAEQRENYSELIKLIDEDEQHPEAWPLFCRDAALDYIHLLAKQLPGEMAVCLLLDAMTVSDPLLLAELLVKDKYGEVHRLIKNSCLPVEFLTLNPKGMLGIEALSKIAPKPISLGICLPEKLDCGSRKKFKKAVDLQLACHTNFRFTSEATLTSEWDGLDHLIVLADAMTPTGKRKLQGFSAAGGEIIPL